MPRTHYEGQRDLSDALMDRTARLMRIRDLMEQEIVFNRHITGLAVRTEAALRKNGNPERIANMLTPDAATSNVAD